MGKARKKPRMKRAYLKKFASHMINTGSGVDTHRMAELAYHKRVEGNVDLAVMLGLATNTGSKPHVEALKAMDDLIHGDPDFMKYHFEVERTFKYTLSLKYGVKGGKCCFFEVHKTGHIRRSVIYNTRDIAMARYHTNHIQWVEHRSPM